MRNKTAQIKLRRADRMRRAINPTSLIIAKAVLGVLIIIALGLFAVSAAINFNLYQSNYNAANACTAHWVAQGVERADISRVSGECFINTTK